MFWVHVVPLLGYEQTNTSRDGDTFNARQARTVLSLVIGKTGIFGRGSLILTRCNGSSAECGGVMVTCFSARSIGISEVTEGETMLLLSGARRSEMLSITFGSTSTSSIRRMNGFLSESESLREVRCILYYFVVV
mmetsp:Transcript_548/g.1297  ORF Transcript_548/g.1297 Transcript_548/m.1297 type:complete len:135 (+) Transcript_548:212-616(+)